MKRVIYAASGVLTVCTAMSMADVVTIAITNNQPVGGFSFSPVWFAFHDGTFAVFDAGAPASAGTELVAELGDATTLMSDFAASGSSGVQGSLQTADELPQFTPAELASVLIDTGDATLNRYFSFAAMFVPSNDFFFSNDDSMAWEVFDDRGSFLGPVTIQIFGVNIWDAGTEVENVFDGGAFVVGIDALISPAENGVIHGSFSSQENSDYIAGLLGVETPVGAITDPFTDAELLATIQIIPEPSMLICFMVSALALMTAPRRA